MEQICILGLGYIGLPTASIFATNGYKVHGVDINRNIIETLNNGDVHIKELGLGTLVKTAIQSGNFRASTVPIRADVFIIAVPTPINDAKEPDLTAVFAATKSIIPFLEKGNIIILESTCPPGTTHQIAERIMKERPDLHQTALSGSEGMLVDLAYCPERVLPGRILKELIENDRIVGGTTKKAAERAANLYEKIVEGKIYQTDATTAEMVKLAENTYRDVNIAIANEFAIICDGLGLNVWEVFELANKHPRVNFLRPGPGVGGHCIAIDPWFLVSEAPDSTDVIRSARKRNDGMPHFVVNKIKTYIAGIHNPKIAILGITYKANVDDPRESPSVEIIKLLSEIVDNNISIQIHDPLVKSNEFQMLELEQALQGADLVVFATDHDQFRRLAPSYVSALVRRKVIFDTRNFLNFKEWTECGFTCHLLGANQAKDFRQ